MVDPGEDLLVGALARCHGQGGGTDPGGGGDPAVRGAGGGGPGPAAGVRVVEEAL